MSERVKFFMSFRARLMLLLTSFVLLTIILVLTLDNWTRERANEEVETQSGEIKDAVNDGFSDFAVAIGLAIQNLSSERYLYKQIEAGEVKLPPTVEHIIVADKDGKVSDTTLPELDGGSIPVPEQEVIQQGSVDPVEGSVEIHGGKSKTYSIPFTSSKGLYWIVIVTTQQSIIQQIDTALLTLSDKSRELSNIRSLATGVLLLMALAIAVIIGWRSIPATRTGDAGHKFDLSGSVLLSAVLVGTAGLLTRGPKDALAFAAASDELEADGFVTERSYLVDLVRRCRGNVPRAARAARMDRNHLRDLLRRHGVDGEPAAPLPDPEDD